MALTANFYQFGKKNNSTKQPTLVNLSFTCSVELKESCSIVNPVLVINFNDVNVSDGVILGTNYLQLVNFNRYYFITTGCGLTVYGNAPARPILSPHINSLFCRKLSILCDQLMTQAGTCFMTAR